jgi:hypothetical protein
MYTGRRPKEVLSGTLEDELLVHSMLLMVPQYDLPNKVAKAKHQDCYASEFDNVCQVRIKVLDVVRKHRSQSQWSEALRERHSCRGSDTESLPHR